MATSVDTLIANARAYADSAVSSAIAVINSLDEFKSLTEQLKNLITKLPEWDYTKMGDDARNALHIVESRTPPPYSPMPLDVKLPEKPDVYKVNYPQEPNFLDIPAPPSLTDVYPIDDILNKLLELIAVIEDLPSRVAQASILFDVINDKLLNDLMNGSYGIEPRDEIDLWNRTRDRESILANAGIWETKKQHSAFGMPIPPGALYDSIRLAIAKAQDQMSTVNRDISIKRADLYRQTREFTITKAIDAAIAQFKDLTAIKIQAMRDAILAEIDAIKLEYEANKDKIEIWKAQIEGISQANQNMFGIFKGRMERERLGLESYRSELEGYQADINAYIAGLNKLSLSVDVYKADISKWVSNLEAITRTYGVLQQANADQLNADRLALQGMSENLKSEITAIGEILQFQASRVREIANIYSHKVSGALASLNTLVGQVEELIETK